MHQAQDELGGPPAGFGKTTLVMAWLIFAQGSLLLLSYAYIRTGEFKITLGDEKADGDIEENLQGEEETSDA